MGFGERKNECMYLFKRKKKKRRKNSISFHWKLRKPTWEIERTIRDSKAKVTFKINNLIIRGGSR